MHEVAKAHDPAADRLQAEGKEGDEEHAKEIRDDIVTGVRDQIILDVLAEDLKVGVAQDELLEFLFQTAQQYGMEPAQFLQGAQQERQYGADLGAASEHTIGGTISAGVYSDDFHEALFGMLRAIVSAPVPVIADIHGPVIGAGTQLALACDLRVAGDKAWFRVPVASLGFALDGWTIHRAQNLLGGALARNMLIANQRVTASQAAAVGFIIPVKNPAQAEEFAYEVSRLAPLAMQQLKTALNAQDATYQLSADAQALFDACWSSTDIEEAKQARAERRAPIFHGR